MTLRMRLVNSVEPGAVTMAMRTTTSAVAGVRLASSSGSRRMTSNKVPRTTIRNRMARYRRVC